MERVIESITIEDIMATLDVEEFGSVTAEEARTILDEAAAAYREYVDTALADYRYSLFCECVRDVRPDLIGER